MFPIKIGSVFWVNFWREKVNQEIGMKNSVLPLYMIREITGLVCQNTGNSGGFLTECGTP